MIRDHDFDPDDDGTCQECGADPDLQPRCRAPLRSEHATAPAPITRTSPSVRGGLYASQAPPQPEPDLRPDPLGPAALIGLPGDVVRATAPHTEADPAAVLLTFLALAGALIGRRPALRVGSTAHRSNLFVVLVGDSARARKGTSWNDVAQFIDPADLADLVLGGFGSGESVIDHLADVDPDDPQARPADRRLLIHEGEYARVLKASSREGSVLSEVIRDAYDGKRLQARTRARRVVASNAHVSAVAHITRAELERTLSAVDLLNGFANRFLWVSVSRSRLLPDVEPVPEDVRDDLAGRLRRAVLFDRPATIRRTPEAQALWNRLYLAADKDTPPGALGSLVARDTDHIIRLSIVYAVLAGSDVIDVPHLEAAREVWRYSRDSLPVIFGTATGDPVADRLFRAIAAAPDGLTATAQRDAFARHVPAARLEAARTHLLEAGRIVEDRTPTGGRPITRHRVAETAPGT